MPLPIPPDERFLYNLGGMISMLTWLKTHFLEFQMILGGAALAIAWIFLRPKEPESNFKVREADLRRSSPDRTRDSPSLADARMRTSPSAKAPLRLAGIRLDLPPHELLGVGEDATPAQIQKAYRELMKQYHPDKVGRPGTREWQDAQTIAEAINRAKNELLERAKR